jgi:hypothetical protein
MNLVVVLYKKLLEFTGVFKETIVAKTRLLKMYNLNKRTYVLN